MVTGGETGTINKLLHSQILCYGSICTQILQCTNHHPVLKIPFRECKIKGPISLLNELWILQR